MKRRNFLKLTTTSATALAFPGAIASVISGCSNPELFKISLAEWSLHRALQSGKIDHLDFCSVAKNKFNIKAVEYVNSFFFDKGNNLTYLNEMKKRADDLGVKSLLIMCDNEGNLGDPSLIKRTKSVENHFKWVEAAKILGCHSIRVNARSEGTFEEQINLASDGLSRLAEFAESIEINVLVENHGGLSSSGKWLSAVMEKIDHPSVGTLPDFGNFKIKNDEWYDRYKGMKELMPYAKAVSAKSHEFNSQGDEINSDYYKIMKIVIDAGYKGYVGIEYEGNLHTEMNGIQLTKDLLVKVRSSIA